MSLAGSIFSASSKAAAAFSCATNSSSWIAPMRLCSSTFWRGVAATTTCASSTLTIFAWSSPLA